MSFDIPTPTTTQKRLEAEAALVLKSQRASLTGTPENMIVRIVNLAITGLYGFIATIALQIIPTVKTNSLFLKRHASFWLENGPKVANEASGDVIVVGTAGSIIPEGTIVSLGSNTYFFTGDVTIDIGGTVTGEIKAFQAGSSLNIASGIALTLSEALIGVGDIHVAADGITGGTDDESDYSLLNRIIDRVQNPPHGGNLKDYETWAREVPGTTRAWANESDNGVVTVDVTFVMDDKLGTIIPSVQEVESVFNYIEVKRPVGSRPNVFAPAAQVIDLSIALNPNTVAVQNSVEAELIDFFDREASPAGIKLFYSRISEAISVGAGENSHNLILPAATLTIPFGTLPVLGAVTWSDL